MKLPMMHCRAAWALLWGRFKSSAVSLLILLQVVLSQTVQKTVPVLEGHATNLTCGLDCGDPANCLLWTHKGPDDESFQVGRCSSDCGSCRTDCPHPQSEQCRAIRFENTQRSCTAVYQCQVYGYGTTSAQEASYRVKLDVHYPPSKLTVSDSRPIAVQGQPFELSCHMDDLGNPEANIRWQPETDGDVTQSRGSSTSTIRFEQVDHQTMARELKCYPTQDGGLVSEEVLQNLGVSVPLEIYYPPESVQIQHTSTVLYTNIGDRLDLNCTVGQSNPSPTISWWKNGVRVQPGDSTLAIAQVGQTDLGEYVCKASIDVPRLGVHWNVTSNPVTVLLESDGHMTTTGRTTPAIVTTPHLSTAKATTEMEPIMAEGVQEDSSAKEHEVFTIGVIMSCAFVGLIFLSVVAVVAWVFKKRKSTPRTSQLQLQENGTTSSLSGDGIAPRQETSLPVFLPVSEYSIETIDTGLTSDADPPLSAVGLPVQVSSIHPYLQEPNFNPRLPIMVSLKTTTPQQRVGHLQNAAPGNGDTTQTSPKLAATDNTPDRILRRNEETPPKDKARASKRSECKSAFSSTSADRATRPKAVANARQREDIRRSVSLDESTPSEPHTLCSNLPDSVSCPLLDEMISEKSTTEKEPEIRRETSREGRCEEKRSPSKRKEETGPTAGLFGSMDTIEEDTAHIVKKKPPIGNQSGRKSLDVEALSLGGNKVATTIVQMIKKQLVGNGHFDLPYHKFSDLCLRLYNTGSNWKVLAGKLGLTVEDVVLIDNCSAQHGLIAAEIVLRHWQRTADQDDMIMTPCNLQNLQDILTDMGRKDLVEMLKN